MTYLRTIFVQDVDTCLISCIGRLNFEDISW
jgi:hypothetical protein